MGDTTSLSLTEFPKELRLILSLLKMDEKEKAVPDNEEMFEGIDWDLFLKLVKHHTVYPTIYLLLKKLDKALIPENVRDTLHKDYCRNTFHMLYLSREMEHVCKIFAENNIPLLVLKGPVLAVDLYGDISLRKSVDLDVLVSIDDLDRVEQMLLDHEYVKYDFFSTELDDWKWRIHHLDYMHPQTRVNLEIHWRLNPGPGKEPSFNELWSRKRTRSITNYPIHYLAREDLFLFLVTHGARHGWSRLGWLMDINKLVKQGLNWESLTKLMKKYQCLHIGGQALFLSSQLLHTPISEEAKISFMGRRSHRLAHEALFYIKRIVNLHTDPVPEDVTRYHQRHLFSLMSNQQKLLFLMSWLYPYPIDYKTLPLPKYLHFLYVPLRPILWAWRKARARES